MYGSSVRHCNQCNRRALHSASDQHVSPCVCLPVCVHAGTSVCLYCPKGCQTGKEPALCLVPARNLQNCTLSGGRISSVGSTLGSLSSVMQRRGVRSSTEHLVEGIFPLELTCVLTPFPKTLSDESTCISRGLVCAHIYSIARIKTILTLML